MKLLSPIEQEDAMEMLSLLLDAEYHCETDYDTLPCWRSRLICKVLHVQPATAVYPTSLNGKMASLVARAIGESP